MIFFPDSLLKDLVKGEAHLQARAHGNDPSQDVERSRRKAIVVVISCVRKRHASLVAVAEPSTALPPDSGAAGYVLREIFP